MALTTLPFFAHLGLNFVPQCDIDPAGAVGVMTFGGCTGCGAPGRLECRFQGSCFLTCPSANV